jgi:hypothetical protein
MNINGGEITSDTGVLLLRQAERHLGSLDSIAQVLSDPRDQSKVVHDDALSMVRQRVYELPMRTCWIIGIYAGIQHSRGL